MDTTFNVYPTIHKAIDSQGLPSYKLRESVLNGVDCSTLSLLTPHGV
jgi:hypothetical protein